MNGPAYQQTIITLDANGSSSRIPIFGEFLSCLDATGAFKLSIDGGPPTVYVPGLQYVPPDGRVMKAIRLEDVSGAQNAVTMSWGVGGLVDSRATIAGSVQVKPVGADGLLTVASISAVVGQVVAANASRRRVILRNDHATADAYIGFDNGVAGAANGMTLVPGQAMTLEVTDAIWAIRSAGSGKIQAIEEVNT